MAEVPVTQVPDGQPCFVCEDGTIAEPEIEGVIMFFECPECGSTFGHRRTDAPQDDTCAMGVDETTRRRFSAPPGEPHDHSHAPTPAQQALAAPEAVLRRLEVIFENGRKVS